MTSITVDISNDQCSSVSFSRVLNYLETLLSEQDNYPKLMASLLVIENLFEKDPKREQLRKMAVDSGIFKKLFKLLKPYPVFENNIIKPFLTSSPLLYAAVLKHINSLIYQEGIDLLKCLDLPSLKILMSFLVPSPGEFNLQPHHFYQYNVAVTDVLKELLLNNHPRVLVKLHSKPNQSVFIKELALYEPMYSRIRLHNKIQLCSIRVPGGKAVHVADHLIEQKLVWKKTYKEAENNEKVKGWMDCSVTNVVNGAFFWILFGKDSMKVADEVTETLNSHRDGLEKIEALKFDAVVVETPADSGRKMVRATVMYEQNGIYAVYAVDSGHVYEVDCVFRLPVELSFSEIPPLAILCRLEDILPKPLNYRAVEMALSSLNILSRYLPGATEQLLEMEILSHLPNLITCPDPGTINQALNLSANLLFRKRIQFCDKWKQIMLSCLEVLEQCIQRNIAQRNRSPPPQTSGDCKREQGDKVTEKADDLVNSDEATERNNVSTHGLEETTVIQTANEETTVGQTVNKNVTEKIDDLVNSDEENEANQRNNVSTHGLEETTVSKTVNKKIVNNCLLLLSNRLFMCPKAKNFFCFNKGILSVIRVNLLHPKHQIIHKSSVQVLCNYVRSVGERLYKSPRGDSQEKVIQNKNLQEPTITSVPVPSQGSEELNKENNKFYGIYEEPQLDPDDSSDSNGHDKLTRNNVTSVLFNQDEDKREQFILAVLRLMNSTVLSPDGEKLPFVSDKTHELHHTYNLSPEIFSRIVCGMLNTGEGGKFYFGVDKSGIIAGERITKTIRDEIRLGLDQILSNIVPAVFHMQYGVRFVPVVEPSVERGNGHGGHPTESAELFVVVMSFKPVRRVVYCCNGGESFYRRGNKTAQLLQQDVWELCILEEEVCFLDEINALRSELAALQEEDAMLKELAASELLN